MSDQSIKANTTYIHNPTFSSSDNTSGNNIASAENFVSSKEQGSFLEDAILGATMGDYSDRNSGAKVIGQTLAGLVPVYGQIGDFRDSSAAIIKIKNGEKGGWTALGLSAIGWVPGVGDYVKGVIKSRDAVKASKNLNNLVESGVESSSKLADTRLNKAMFDQSAEQGKYFYKPSATGVSNKPAGWGATDAYGNIEYSLKGSKTDQALAYHHEKMHSILSPKFSALKKIRAEDISMNLYQNSNLMRYMEEALAESYAQLKVNGIKNLPEGIKFPIENGYVELKDVVQEGATAAITVGNLHYGVYLLAKEAND